jgi:hypothetical protein
LRDFYDVILTLNKNGLLYITSYKDKNVVLLAENIEKITLGNSDTYKIEFQAFKEHTDMNPILSAERTKTYFNEFRSAFDINIIQLRNLDGWKCSLDADKGYFIHFYKFEKARRRRKFK